MWNQCRYALEFFRKYEPPFWDIKCEDELTANTDDYVLCKPSQIYLVYLKHGGKVQLNAPPLLSSDRKTWGLLLIKGSGKLDLASREGYSS